MHQRMLCVPKRICSSFGRWIHGQSPRPSGDFQQLRPQTRAVRHPGRRVINTTPMRHLTHVDRCRNGRGRPSPTALGPRTRGWWTCQAAVPTECAECVERSAGGSCADGSDNFVRTASSGSDKIFGASVLHTADLIVSVSGSGPMSLFFPPSSGLGLRLGRKCRRMRP